MPPAPTGGGENWHAPIRAPQVDSAVVKFGSPEASRSEAVQRAPIQAIIAAEMEVPPGPLRSPDGLWWWDGKAWQPIATLSVPPTLPLAPSSPAPSPAPDPAPPAHDVWQPPPAASDAGGAWTPPPVETGQPPSGAWQPPGAISELAPTAELPNLPPSPPSPPAPIAPPSPAASTSPTVVPPPPPPPPAPPKEEVQWPTWLPQTPASEAVVQGARFEHAPVVAPSPPPPSAATAPRALVRIPGEGGASTWASQFYPAAGKLTSNRQVLIWAGVAILGLVAIYVVFQVLTSSNLFGGKGGPGPDLGPSGTQSQQADAFLTVLNPTLDASASAYRPIAVDCGGTHSVTCRSTLEDADAATVKAIAVIDGRPFPNCLAATVVQSRHDLVNMEQALKTAVIGFHSNADDLTTRGLKDFNALSPALKTDQDALRAAGQTACPKGP